MGGVSPRPGASLEAAPTAAQRGSGSLGGLEPAAASLALASATTIGAPSEAPLVGVAAFAAGSASVELPFATPTGSAGGLRSLVSPLYATAGLVPVGGGPAFTATQPAAPPPASGSGGLGALAGSSSSAAASALAIVLFLLALVPALVGRLLRPPAGLRLAAPFLLLPERPG
jgi:hypothetical protein